MIEVRFSTRGGRITVLGLVPGTRVAIFRQRDLDMRAPGEQVTALAQGLVDRDGQFDQLAITNSVEYSQDIPVVVRARLAGYLPFQSEATLRPDAGFEIHVPQVVDHIYMNPDEEPPSAPGDPGPAMEPAVNERVIDLGDDE